MSQEAEQNPQESTQDTQEVQVVPPLGVRLRAAREARQLSVADVARALKLSPRQIEALEVGDWSGLPGATFIRGFVRNYARQVGIDAAPLMVELESQLGIVEQRLEVATNASGLMPEQHKPQRQDYLVVLLGLFALALACGAYFLLPDDFWQRVEASVRPAEVAEPATTVQPAFPPPPTSAELAQGALPPVNREMPAEAASSAAPAPLPAAAASAAATTAPVAPAAAAVAAAAPAVAPTTPPATPPATPPVVPAAVSTNALHLSVVQPSWVEVRDRDGKVLLSQHNLAGTEKDLNGAPPLSVVVGYVPGVKLTWRGKAVDLMAYSKGDVARFNLE